MVNVHQLKKDICEIGRRLYNKGFAAANDGNITVKVSENEFLCTPTMHSKGFLVPEDIATIDATGKQIAGRKKRSSEALLHLEIYKQRGDVNSVVHCHPPHATAFAVAREPIPQCVLPEVEVFLGDVPITRYETPGGQAFADTIFAVCGQDQRHHSGESRHGQLRRGRGTSLLVDRDSGCLLPHPDVGQELGPRELLYRRRRARVASVERAMGVSGSPQYQAV